MRMWRKRNTSPLLVGLPADTTTQSGVPQKFDIVLPEDPAIPLLSLYPKHTLTYSKDICS